MSRILRMTEQDLSKFERFSGRDRKETLGKPTKYRAVPTEVNGIRFHSKGEAARYAELMRLVEVGEVSYFLRQVPFDLPGGVVYRLDFLIVRKVLPRGHAIITYEDFKGYMTPASKIKIRQVEAIYGIEVLLTTRRRA